MMSLVLAVASLQLSPQILARLEGDDMARVGIVAELVHRPTGVTDEEFAQQVVDAEGLRPWNGEQLNFPHQAGRMGGKAVFSGDGRQVAVYFVPSDITRSGQVCRLRATRGGLSDAYWRAQRWCASAFGITLPQKRAPIVTMSPVK